MKLRKIAILPILILSLILLESCSENSEKINSQKSFNIKIILPEQYNAKSIPSSIIEVITPFKIDDDEYWPNLIVTKMFGISSMDITQEFNNSFIKPNFESLLKKQREALENLNIEQLSAQAPSDRNIDTYLNYLLTEGKSYLIIPTGKSHNYAFLSKMKGVDILEFNNLDSTRIAISSFLDLYEDGEILIIHDINFLIPSQNEDLLSETDMLLNQIKMAESKKEDLLKYKKEITERIEKLLPYSDLPDAKQQLDKLRKEENTYQIKIINQSKLIELYEQQIRSLKSELKEEKQKREETEIKLGTTIDSLTKTTDILENNTTTLKIKLENIERDKVLIQIKKYTENARPLIESVTLAKDGSLEFYEKRNGEFKRVSTNQKRYNSFRIDYFKALCEYYKPAYYLALDNQISALSLERETEKIYEIYKKLVLESDETKKEKLPSTFRTFFAGCE